MEKFSKTMASLSPGAQEAMAGVITIMNAKLEALIMQLTARSGDAKHPTINLAADEADRSTACS